MPNSSSVWYDTMDFTQKALRYIVINIDNYPKIDNLYYATNIKVKVLMTHMDILVGESRAR